MKRAQIVIVLTVTLLIVVFIPVFKVVTVPQWKIKVVDEEGRTKPGVEVRQTWHHYSFDGSGIDHTYGGEEELRSDLSGEIVFPERSFRTSILGIAVATVGSPLRWIDVHDSTGPSAYFMCLGESCSNELDFHYRGNPDELLKNVLVVEKVDTAKEPEAAPFPPSHRNSNGAGSGIGLN